VEKGRACLPAGRDEEKWKRGKAVPHPNPSPKERGLKSIR
jgi:hypothetical protein